MDHSSRHTIDESSLTQSFTDFGAWDWDIVSGDVQWFGTHERLIGMRTKSLSGKVEAFSDVLHPDDRARVWKKVLGMMARRETQYSDQFRFLYQNGTVRWMSGTGRFVYDDSGRPVRMAGVVQDVTVGRRQEQALRDSEERFAKAFRSSPHPIGITEAATGRCIDVNDACLQLFGFDREEVIGNTTLMLDMWSKPEDRSRLVERLKAGEPVRNLESSFRTKSGDVRHILVSSDLVELNGTLCLITVGHDITERKYAEQALHENEAWQRGQKEAFQAAVNGAPLKDSLGALVRTAVRHYGGAARAAFYRVHDDGMTISHVVGMSEAYARSVEGFRIGEDSWDCGVATHRGEPVITPDITQDSRWQPWLWLAQEHRFRACWSFPLLTADGPILGTLALYFSEPRRPTPRDLELVDVLTHAATIIISRHQESSERARAEHALRESEARFRTMAEAVPSFLFETDAAGWNTWTSKDWCRFTGQTPDQVAGHGWADALHPDDRAANLDRWLHCMEKGVPFESQQRLRRTDGTYAWVIARALPVRDDEGTIRRWVGSVTDVDAIARGEEEQARLAAIVEGTGDVVVGKDLQGTITSWNRGAETLLGYTAAEVIGRPVTMLFPPDRMDEEPSILGRLMKGESIRQYETVRRHKDGHDISVSLTISLIRDKQECVIGVAAILRDITERKQAEERLRDTQARLDAMLTAAEIATWTWDIRNNHVVADKNTARLFSVTPKEAAGGPLASYVRAIHPEDRPRVEAAIADALQKGPYEIEYRLIQPDGSCRWVVARGRVEYDAAGTPVRFPGVLIDITERKRAEEALRESELRFRTLVERIGDVFWIADPIQKKLIYASQTFEDVWGMDLQRLHDHFETWFEALHEEDRDRVKHDFYADIYRGQYDSEYRVLRPDGTIRWIRDHGTPLGIGNLVAGVAEDITERKEAEAKLRESEARFRNVFEHAGTGIAIANLYGGSVQCNPAYCEMLGYTEDELRHVDFAQLVHHEDRDANQAELQRLLMDELPYLEIENRYVHKNGQPVWVRKFISLLRRSDRRPIFWVALVTDVTERRKTEQAVRDAQRRLEQWTTELEQAVNEKTVELVHSQARLRALASELSLAEQRERKRLATELHDHLQQILVLGKLEIGQGKKLATDIPECETVLDRVDDILSEALTYSRTLVAELSPPVLHDYGLAAGIKWLGNYMRRHGQAVTVLVPHDHELTLSEDQLILLFQSVRELLINSLKHADTGQATVMLEHHDGSLSITVRDEGKGFDLAVAAAAAVGIPSGGLSSKFGLFSIQERMRALGGKLDLLSAPGQGTTATLTLPLATVRSSSLESLVVSPHFSDSSTPSTQHSKLSSTSVRVLLVDDHIMVRQGLRSVLDAYEDLQVVGEAQDGSEAVSLAGKLRPHVVVMDINMPKMNGIEATARIKAYWPETIVIGISVNTGDDNSHAMKRAGATTLLTKEAAVEQLHEIIKRSVKKGETAE